MTLTLEQKKAKAREILENVIIPTPLRIQEKLSPQLYASWFLDAVEEIEALKKEIDKLKRPMIWKPPLD